MSPRELRKLYKKLSSNWQELLHKRMELRKLVQRADDSMSRTQRLESRVKYWGGKNRAIECPAYKPIDGTEGYCMVNSPSWVSNTRSLFTYKCFECRLQRKTRMKVGTFNGVFGKKVP